MTIGMSKDITRSHDDDPFCGDLCDIPADYTFGENIPFDLHDSFNSSFAINMKSSFCMSVKRPSFVDQEDEFCRSDSFGMSTKTRSFCGTPESFCNFAKHLSMPSPTSLDTGLIAPSAIRSRVHARRGAVGSSDPSKTPHVAPADSDHGMRHIVVCSDAFTKRKCFDAVLPFVRVKGRTVTSVWCSDRCEHRHAHAVEREIADLEAWAGAYGVTNHVEVWLGRTTSKEDVARLLLRESQAFGPDLVVVGDRHGGVFSGPTCDTVLRESPGSVLVIRSVGPSYCPEARMMVAIDGSPESLSALHCAMQLASDTPTTLVPVVTAPGPQALALVQLALQTPRAQRCAIAAPSLGALQAQYSLAQNLCILAQERDVDFLVVGAAPGGPGAAESFLIHHAHCHVLVHRAQQEGPSGGGGDDGRGSHDCSPTSCPIPIPGARKASQKSSRIIPLHLKSLNEAWV